MIYRVTLENIVWDDGNGEYDVSEGPKRLVLTVEAPSSDAAIEYAMSEADENYGCLIEGADTSVEHIGD